MKPLLVRGRQSKQKEQEDYLSVNRLLMQGNLTAGNLFLESENKKTFLTDHRRRIRIARREMKTQVFDGETDAGLDGA